MKSNASLAREIVTKAYGEEEDFDYYWRLIEEIEAVLQAKDKAMAEVVSNNEISEAMYAHPDHDNYDFDWNVGFRAGFLAALQKIEEKLK